MSSISSVCGLGLEVDVPLAGLKGLLPSRRVDVHASLGSMPPDLECVSPAAAEEIDFDTALDENGVPSKRVWRVCDGRYYRIDYSDGTTIVVDSRGERIWATWQGTLEVEDVAAYLLGPILGFVLRLRGVTCLHASAVAIGGHAIALVGPSGRGKSSTAAAFARMGHAVLADDVVALRDEGDEFRVEPAFPRLHLWPESSEFLFGARDALPRITPGWDKRFLDLNRGEYRFQHEALPLTAIYLLDERHTEQDAHRIEAISPRDGLMTLVSDAHASVLVGPRHRAQEFESLSRLVECVRVRRVTPCADFARVQELCEAIVRDLHV